MSGAVLFLQSSLGFSKPGGFLATSRSRPGRRPTRPRRDSRSPDAGLESASLTVLPRNLTMRRHLRWIRFVLVPLLFGALAGSGLTSCQGSVVERPTRVGSLEYESTLPRGKYRILPGDELEVRFFHTPDHNVVAPVRPDGFISLPLAGDVSAAGRTPDDVAKELEQIYGRELRSPQIAVIVKTFSAHKIHVGGRVADPGVVPLDGPMTVLDSLFAAGGVEAQGRLNEILVIRRTPQNALAVIPVNMEAVLDGTDVSQNIRLLPYDAIYVPDSPIGEVNKWVDLYLRQNIPINFGVGLRPELAF